MRALSRNAPSMHQSIEEEEVTAQRDAAVSLFKGLQQRVCWLWPQFRVCNLAALVVLYSLDGVHTYSEYMVAQPLCLVC